MSFTFATERSYNPSSFAQLLQRRQRLDKRPQSSLLGPTGRVMRDEDNSPSSRSYAIDTMINAPRTSSAGLLTPPDSHPRKRRGSTGAETPTKRHQSIRKTPRCSVCGSRAQIKQCQSCAEVYLCSYCTVHAPLAHPFPGHSLGPTDHKATVAYGGMEKNVSKLHQDLDDKEKDKEIVHEDSVDSVPKDTGHKQAAPFPCRFCGKDMEGSWYECQDCEGAHAHFCFHHTWLHDRLHTSHTTKAISVSVEPGRPAGDHISGAAISEDKEVEGEPAVDAVRATAHRAGDDRFPDQDCCAVDIAHDAEIEDALSGGGALTENDACSTEDEVLSTEDEAVSTEDDISEYDIYRDSSQHHGAAPSSILSFGDNGDQEKDMDSSDHHGEDNGEDDFDNNTTENVILALSQAAKVVQAAAAQAADAIASATELLQRGRVPPRQRRMISNTLLEFDIPKRRTRQIGRHRSWRPEEKRRLARMKTQGMSDEQVAEALKRSASAVSQQWRKQRMS